MFLLPQQWERRLERRRVVVIGGTGNFGARICRRLSAATGVEVVATGRAAQAAGSGAGRYAQLDLDAQTLRADLAALQPAAVIHCAGPFQGQDYRVALAALGAGAHYLDLADGRDFVARFAGAVQAAAVRARRAAVSGASTLPGLSSAVIDHLLPRFSRLDSIDMAIAPGQRAPRGNATLAAVLSYAGRPFPWWVDGRWQTAHGWQQLRRMHFPFGHRLAAACDVPDLALYPEHYAGVHTVTFRAALELPVQQLAVWSLAGLRRCGLPLPLQRWAAPLNRVAGRLDGWGGDCGGMSVELTGLSLAGARQRVRWLLTARDNHGPEIPCMPAVLLALKLMRGEGPAQGAAPMPGRALTSGARPCVGLLALQDFAPEFERWGITTLIEAD